MTEVQGKNCARGITSQKARSLGRLLSQCCLFILPAHLAYFLHLSGSETCLEVLCFSKAGYSEKQQAWGWKDGTICWQSIYQKQKPK